MNENNQFQALLEGLCRFWEKLKCFLKRHRIAVILFGCAAAALLLIGRTYVEQHNNVLISGITVNVTVADSAAEELTEACRREFTQGGRWEKIRLSQVTIGSFFAIGAEYQKSVSTVSSIQSLNANEELDYIITDQHGFETLLKSSEYLDLRKLFTQAELDTLGDKLIYARFSDPDGESLYPVAVDISQTDYAVKHMTTQDAVYFCVASCTPRLEEVRFVWDLLTQG